MTVYNNTIDLNKTIIKDVKFLLNFRIIFDKFNRVIIYTIIDMVARYWQVKVWKENISKTVFVIVWGQYKYLRMLFGLYNTLVTFQQLMNHIFYNYLGEFVIVYLDNVIIYFKSIVEYIKYLD